MTKKEESDVVPEAPIDPKLIEKRKHLLARMAGNIAAGVITSPPTSSKSMTSAEAIATISVDVAEAILKKIGL
jgi:hypothetical protein